MFSTFLLCFYQQCSISSKYLLVNLLCGSQCKFDDTLVRSLCVQQSSENVIEPTEKCMQLQHIHVTRQK